MRWISFVAFFCLVFAGITDLVHTHEEAGSEHIAHAGSYEVLSDSQGDASGLAAADCDHCCVFHHGNACELRHAMPLQPVNVHFETPSDAARQTAPEARLRPPIT